MRPSRLIEHPEGGRFQEVFRSASRVTTESSTSRSALTHIYFSLRAHEISRFHRVVADEIWNLYQGEGLCLYLWDGSSSQVESVILSGESQHYCHVVPAGSWQAAEPLNREILVGCSVAPGFEFEDFTLISPDSKEADLLRTIDPALGRFIDIPNHHSGGDNAA